MKQCTPGTDGISNTLTTVLKDNYALCIAVRGRYNETGKINQKLEPRYDGITNSLTTVQKDNMVLIVTPPKDKDT